MKNRFLRDMETFTRNFSKQGKTENGIFFAENCLLEIFLEQFSILPWYFAL